ncbi:MAG: porin family protein [Nitrosomonadales bacterium]|nr:porin family protein [Nitrosomonadales bacterium]
MKKILVAALLSTVIAAPVFAASNGADAGVYGGFTVGQAKMDNPYVGYATTDDKDTVGSIFLGYQYTKNWGVEAFYSTVGKLTARNAAGTIIYNTDSDAFGLNVVGTAPLNESFSLYGKLGYARANTNAHSSPVGLAGRDNSNVTGGVGALFNIDKKMGIRFGIDRYEATTISGNVANVEEKFWTDVWAVGLVFKF